MSTAIIYYSEHHGNTKKLLDAIKAADPAVELIDVTKEAKAVPDAKGHPTKAEIDAAVKFYQELPG